jgi:hemerythrin-like domain-containing protein
MSHPFITHLKEDHEKQRKLAQELTEAKSHEEVEKSRQALYDALYPHIEGEDASIFDFLKTAGDKARSGALEAMEEHHVDRVLLNELMEMDLNDERLLAKAKVLKEVNGHHLDEEEEEHFPRLESLASDSDLDNLFKQYESTEEEFKSEHIS